MRQPQANYPGKIVVYLVEPNPLLKRLILARLKTEAGIQVLGQQRAEVLLSAQGARGAPLTVLIDKVAVAPRFGTVLQNITSSPLRCRVAIVDNEDITVPDLCALISIGVHGFLPFAHLKRQLVPAIEALSRGELWFPPSVLDYYVKEMNSILYKRKAGGEEMTFRQEQVISLVKKGLSNKEISTALNISGSTVKFHLAKVFAKLGIQDRRSILVPTNPRTGGPESLSPMVFGLHR